MQAETKEENVGAGGPHDVGGVVREVDKLVTENEELEYWELKMDALLSLLAGKGLITDHELRRSIESLDPLTYDSYSYFEKWAFAIATVSLERGVLTESELNASFGSPEESAEPIFSVGDKVRVRQEDFASRWRKPHLRTPGYIFGKVGVVIRYAGQYENPQFAAFRVKEVTQPLYRVSFKQRDLWNHYDGHPNDSLEIEIFQDWLIPFEGKDKEVEKHHQEKHKEEGEEDKGKHQQHHEHKHEHDGQPHVHEKRAIVEQNAVDKEGEPRPAVHLANALVEAMLSKDLFTADELRARIERRSFLPDEGKRCVARAWLDPDYKARLLEDGSAGVAECGVDMKGVQLIVVENTDDTHNIVVCTLCSCYPRQLLGRPPSWYKSRSYRSRVPREPRKVLREFGVDVGVDKRVVVHDSNADLRYMVIPQMPAGVEGWSEDQLMSIISRDTMVGVALVPSQL